MITHGERGIENDRLNNQEAVASEEVWRREATHGFGAPLTWHPGTEKFGGAP